MQLNCPELRAESQRRSRLNRMKRLVPLFLLLSIFFVRLEAQTQTPSVQPAAVPTAAELAADVTAFNQLLGQLQQVSQKTADDLGRLRVDKWKADREVKDQAQSNLQSLQRNLRAALPDLISKVQAAPQDLAPNFRLYRNLNALYDVLASVAESAGAFGPSEQYDPVAADVGSLDSVRRSVADRLDWLSGVRDAEVVRLRKAQATSTAPAKKVISDEETPTSTPKKKKTKPSAAHP